MSDHGKIHQLASKAKLSKNEEIKQNSKHLRSTIAEELAGDKPALEENDLQTIKFHGIYQQDDRDARSVAKVTGLGRAFSFMARIKIPGGVLTPEQYIGMDRLADEVVTNRSLRVTTRQNFQLHGVLKGDLKSAIQRVNDVMLSTLCGCGDIERNIMAPPAPLQDAGHHYLRALANELTEQLAPKTNAYVEVWLDGEKVDTSQEGPDPLYGPTYLPRKFKTALALPEDNSVDIHSQDMGLIAIMDGDKVQALNLLVGGGNGLTHKLAATYARLGSELGSIAPEHAVEAVKVVIGMFRDYGDRTDRKHARIKYVVEEFGMDAFREEFNRRASFKLQPWKPIGQLQHQDWLGAHEQGDGKYFYGLYIPQGRIIDGETVRYKSAIRTIVEAFQCEVVLTPNQNILFGGLEEKDLKTIERVLDAFHVPSVEQITRIRRHSMACPALPTCGLALTEAERVFPEVITEMEKEFARVGMDDEPITIRMTGCPNGCARPYTADIGLVGHKPGHYDIYLGGTIRGDRMNEYYSENVPLADLPAAIRPLLEAWKNHRMPEESLGDFYHRVFASDRRTDLLTGSKDNPAIERIDFTQLTVAGTAAH